MEGYIFLCDSQTEPECLERLLFGTNNSNVYEQTLSRIKVGDYLFLYNYDLGTLKGPFRALTQCTKDLEKNAWKNSRTKGVPFQVRVSDSDEFSKPISIDEFSSIVTFSGNFPQSKISQDKLLLLWKVFEK